MSSEKPATAIYAETVQAGAAPMGSEVHPSARSDATVSPTSVPFWSNVQSLRVAFLIALFAALVVVLGSLIRWFRGKLPADGRRVDREPAGLSRWNSPDRERKPDAGTLSEFAPERPTRPLSATAEPAGPRATVQPGEASTESSAPRSKDSTMSSAEDSASTPHRTDMGENSRAKLRRGDSENNAALDRDMREANWRRQPKQDGPAPFPKTQRDDPPPEWSDAAAASKAGSAAGYAI